MILTKIYQKLEYLYSYIKRLLFRNWLYRRSRHHTITAKPTVVFAPHQDDETLGCGGLLALKRRQNVPVWVVFLTDGRYCYPEECLIDPEDCVAMRQQEAIKSLQTLGIEANRAIFLDHHDSSLETLDQELEELAIEELKSILNKLQPGEVYVPYHNDLHPDHIETHRLVKKAVWSLNLDVDLWEYPVWSLWYREHLQDLLQSQCANLHRLPIHSVQRQKNAALRCYESQYKKVERGFQVLPQGFFRFFSAPYEMFVKVTLYP